MRKRFRSIPPAAQAVPEPAHAGSSASQTQLVHAVTADAPEPEAEPTSQGRKKQSQRSSAEQQAVPEHAPAAAAAVSARHKKSQSQRSSAEHTTPDQDPLGAAGRPKPTPSTTQPHPEPQPPVEADETVGTRSKASAESDSSSSPSRTSSPSSRVIAHRQRQRTRQMAAMQRLTARTERARSLSVVGQARPRRDSDPTVAAEQVHQEIPITELLTSESLVRRLRAATSVGTLSWAHVGDEGDEDGEDSAAVVTALYMQPHERVRRGSADDGLLPSPRLLVSPLHSSAKSALAAAGGHEREAASGHSDTECAQLPPPAWRKGVMGCVSLLCGRPLCPWKTLAT